MTGDLDITNSVTIAVSNPPHRATIDAMSLDRAFDILAPGHHVTLMYLDIKNGNVLQSASPMGGGLRAKSAESVGLINSSISYSAAGAGGAIASSTRVVLGGVELHHNTVLSSNPLIANGVAIRALWDDAELEIRNSSIHHNTSGVQISQAAIHIEVAPLTVENTTISNNFSSAIHSLNSDVTLTHVTIADNDGYGVRFYSAQPGSVHRTLANTILTNNLYGNCHQLGESFDTTDLFSLDSDTSCDLDPLSWFGNQSGVNPMLGPLAIRSGGKLPVRDLLPGSPAIDRGDTMMATAGGTCLPNDQDGRSRPRDRDGNGSARCDIGAVEVDYTDAAIFRDGFE